jgi:hypothetical protein
MTIIDREIFFSTNPPKIRPITRDTAPKPWRAMVNPKITERIIVQTSNAGDKKAYEPTIEKLKMAHH